MPIQRTYACPDCGEHFRFLHMTRDEPPPSECELCGADMDAPEPELSAVHIGGSSISKAVDMVYETQSAAGKQTNMKDSLREGDVAGMRVVNDVTRYADNSEHNYWHNNALYGSGGTGTGGSRRDLKAQAGVISAMQSRHFGAI